MRVGDQDVSESVIAAYRDRGLTPPDHIVEPPQVKPEFLVFWEAFRDLISERTTPRGPIPVSSILDYADRYGLDRDQLKRIVWATDRILVDHWKSQDKAEENKRKANAGGSSGNRGHL